MKVQQLFLRNVRSIKSLDLDFRDPVTRKPMSRIVLAGANGSGKTTILESVFCLLAAAENYGAGRMDLFDAFSELGTVFSADAVMQLEFEVSFGHRAPVTLSVVYGDSEAAVRDHAADEVAMIGSKSRSTGTTTGRGIVLDRLSSFTRLAESVVEAARRESEAVGSILFFPHTRSLPSVEQGELGFEPRLYEWAYKYQAGGQWKGSIESYLFSLNYLDLEDRVRRIPADRFGQTVELVNSILDGKRIARVEKGRVVVETERGETHSLDNLSSGEKQLVLLLIEITRRIVPGSVILIDEPEISLHPTWQRGLVAALDKIIEQYDAQVIMATHSPEILRMAFPEERIVLTDLDMPRGEWKPELEVAA